MTFYYRTTTTSTNQTPTPEAIKSWKIGAEKANWRIVQLQNGYFQTELEISEGNWRDVTRRETLEGAEAAIDSSVEYFKQKVEYAAGPKVVKTFK